MSREYKDQIVCFVDVLGFRALIDQATDEESGLAIIASLESALASDLIAPIEGDQSLREDAHYSVRMFSDCVCISAPDNFGGFLVVLARLATAQNNLARKGILLRGAISRGKHYESESMIFSEGLVAAYMMESKVALFPRVIICKGLLAHHMSGEMAQQKEALGSIWIAKDFDDQAFVNYFPSIKAEGAKLIALRDSLVQHKDMIVHALEDKKDKPDVMQKIGWVRRYHNHVCQRALPGDAALLIGTPRHDGFEKWQNGEGQQAASADYKL